MCADSTRRLTVRVCVRPVLAHSTISQGVMERPLKAAEQSRPLFVMTGIRDPELPSVIAETCHPHAVKKAIHKFWRLVGDVCAYPGERKLRLLGPQPCEQ